MSPLKLILCSVFFLAGSAYAQQELPQPCTSEIYCYGDLLHTVQMARLENDSKSFVDMALRYPPANVSDNFKTFITANPNPTKEQTQLFVNENFANGTEFEVFNLTDWKENPAFLQDIKDTHLRQFGKDLNKIWKDLGRKIKDDVRVNKDQYSMYYVSHPVVVPGGRFKEFYYWDSYWIQKGLLLSEMTTTVKGMIENFMEIVETIGFVPNGGRIYYQRTQPPLLTPMVKNYYEATKDVEFLKAHIGTLKKEFEYFNVNRTTTVNYNGKDHKMAIYNVQLQGPRPESYREDYELADWLSKTLKAMNATDDFIKQSVVTLYTNLKAGAESGWDFSSRWFVPLPNSHETGDLMNTRTSEIVPVDLNGFLYWNAILLSEFCGLVSNATLCNPTERAGYDTRATQLKEAINEVLWDVEAGSWFDYDTVNKTRRNAFYPTNLVPLWVKAHHNDSMIPKVVDYLKKSGALAYPGGLPTSLFQTGQQWDFPNGWAPLQHIAVEALEYSGNQEAKNIAYDLARKWVQSNHLTFVRQEAMFEKYDVTVVGSQGGGGEYGVVLGFGWSNGVILEFLKMYGARLESLPDVIPTTTPAGTTTEAGAGTTPAQFSAMTLIIVSLFSLFQ